MSRRLAVLALIAFPLVLAACGGGSSPNVVWLELLAATDHASSADVPPPAKDTGADAPTAHDLGAADVVDLDAPADPGAETDDGPVTIDVPVALDTPTPPVDPGKDACVPACSGKVCGPDGCGGQCGACVAPETCDASGQCACVPACTGKVCGPDGCGGQCGACVAPKTCDASGQCACAPACSGKVCGPDGCGGQCGACVAPKTCSASGQCVCTPACSGKDCGPDGCGGVCGACTAPETCDATGHCVCKPSCTGKFCGADGCGGSCGTCPAGSACTNGKCACVPSCAGRECGSDGCTGSCGTCAANAVCTAGKCIVSGDCNGLPSTWGPIGAVATLSLPSDANTVSKKCVDFSGDGAGDNSFALLATYINPLISTGGASGTLGTLFEFSGVKDFANTASFPLNGLKGLPSGSGTGYQLDPSSYDGACHPLIQFPTAKIAGKALSAGPNPFIFQFPLQGGSLVFAMEQARIKATVTSGGAGGVTATDGVLGGVVTQDAMEQTLAIAAAACSGPGAPSYCDYLGMLQGLLPNLMDVDLNKDGTPDAYSICLFLTLTPAKVTGYL